MSNRDYYSDVKIIKKPLKERLKSFFKIFLFIGVVGACFWGAKHLSKALTVGNVGAFIAYGDNKFKIDSSSLYAVMLGEYDTFDRAEEVALGASVQGASGFVWQDTRYYVVGNVYPTEKEALSVLDNLKETKYNVFIKEIHFKSLKLDFGMYENKDMQMIHSAFDVIDKVYESIYKYSVDLDKSEVSHLAVSSYISSIRGEIKSNIINVQNLLNKAGSDLKYVQSVLVKIDELLDEVIIKVIDNSASNYALKYAIASVARLKYEIFNSLK